MADPKYPRSLEDTVAASERKREEERKKKRKNHLIPVTRGARRKSLDDAIEDAGG